jgi:putative glutamine amidotransferase
VLLFVEEIAALVVEQVDVHVAAAARMCFIGPSHERRHHALPFGNALDQPFQQYCVITGNDRIVAMVQVDLELAGGQLRHRRVGGDALYPRRIVDGMDELCVIRVGAVIEKACSRAYCREIARPLSTQAATRFPVSLIPLIAVPADRVQRGLHHQHSVGEKYLQAVTDAAGGLPLMVPALPERLDLRGLLAQVDGVLLTGSSSNILPQYYQGASPAPDREPRDPARDGTNLQLIPLAIDMGVPVLGICRGLQELNVALGGTLLQKVHEQPGKMDHREDRGAPLEVQYGPAHPVHVVAGSLLAAIAGEGEHLVNSVHGQGIDRLAPGLRVEAVAPDGLVEAVSLPSARALTLGVQFHPEWRVMETPFFLAVFRAFGDACRQRARARQGAVA